GAARATRPIAMLPAAPTVFSISTVWPSERVMRSARRRAMVSVGPPAENGTTMTTGFAGNVEDAPCAAAPPAMSARIAANRNLIEPPSVAAETDGRVALDLLDQRHFPVQVLA